MSRIYLEKQKLNHITYKNVLSWLSGFSGLLFFFKFTYYVIIFILAAFFSIDIIESDISHSWQRQDLKWFFGNF